MTVGELIRYLRDVDPGALVVQSRDPEGNRFMRTDGVGLGWYLDNDFHDDGLEEGELQSDGTAYLMGPDEIPCICLWPGDR